MEGYGSRDGKIPQKSAIPPSRGPAKSHAEQENDTENTILKLPIVFIHYSNPPYLRYSLAQAKESNRDSTIYLLGDTTNDCYDFVDHHSFLDYHEGADKFAKIYRHFSTSPYRWILFVFQRLFMLKEFMVANKMERCLHVDSDVMLYANVTEDQKKFDQYDFTVSHRMACSIFYVNRVEALEDFCQFLIDIYTKKDRYHYDKMVGHYAVRNKNLLEGGACEMNAFEYYGVSHFGLIGEVSLIMDGSVYDPNISMPYPGFEMENGTKKLIWRDGNPYGIYLRSGRLIKFNSLHCQGSAKQLMSEYYTGQKEVGLSR